VIPGGRLVVLGKQGAGKGTQCVRLSHHYVIPHISTGDMLRGETKAGTELGLEAQRYMDSGELIPDGVVLAMVAQRLDQDDTRTRGFVLDGFPRTVAQAVGLDELLSPAGLDLAVNIVVPTPLVLRRLASRRVCEDCAAIYSTVSPPRVAWICDACGGEVIHREDDTEAAIHRRLDLYEQQTQPLIAWYRRANKLVSISGVGSPEAVSDRLVAAVDDHRSASGGFGAPLRTIGGAAGESDRAPSEPEGGGAHDLLDFADDPEDDESVWGQSS
jgi:adenylate kinase